LRIAGLQAQLAKFLDQKGSGFILARGSRSAPLILIGGQYPHAVPEGRLIDVGGWRRNPMRRRTAAAEQGHQAGPQAGPQGAATPRCAATPGSHVLSHGVSRARTGLGAAQGNYPRSPRSKLPVPPSEAPAAANRAASPGTVPQ